MDEYFIVINEVPYLKVIKTKKISLESEYLKIFSIFKEFAVGNVYIYRYYKDGTRENLTNKYGKTDYNIWQEKEPEKIYKIKITYTRKGLMPYRFCFYTKIKDIGNKLPSIRFFNFLYSRISMETSSSVESLFICSLSQKLNKSRGDKFEKYIANLYTQSGYKVILNGIKNGVYDNGIDLIAYKDEKVFLIQCKNWIKSSEYKLTHKELKEFLGNCLVYIKTNNLDLNRVSFHYIAYKGVNVDFSAKAFIKENKSILKYKEIDYN